VSEISVSSKKASFFLRVLNIRDRVKDIASFGLEAVTKGAGIVRNKTKIREGKYRGCYIMGIETCDI